MGLIARTRYLRPMAVLTMAVIFSLSMAGITWAGNFDLNVPTYKPLLTGKKWMAVGGMPIVATAGAMTFIKGGNAVDAGAAMLAAAGVMTDGMHIGGETQALVYNPNTLKVYGINGMGAAPTGATADYFLDQGQAYPPAYGPLAAATPGTPGGLMVMLAEFGSLSLGEVLEPAIDLADGYVLTGYRGGSLFRESNVKRFMEFKTPYSRDVWVPNGKPLEFGQILVQRDLAATFRKLVRTERQALAAGHSRKEAIMAAYDRFYKGDIAREIARGSQEGGGLHTYEDMANWTAYVEEPRMTTYHGYEVYKLQEWTQGPVLLQTLNILEGIDLASMDRNSAEYVHAIYQAMNLAYADRDFYYGDPYYPPKEPMEGLLSKEYAAERRKMIDWNKNNPDVGPGDPYPFQGEKNPFMKNIEEYRKQFLMKKSANAFNPEDWNAGTTSIQAADIEGWVCSITPSGGWAPSYIGGRTGVGLGQRMQSFVTDPNMNPFNVIEPGKRPRVTLTPTLILKDGHYFMSMSKRGGDYQEQAMILQFLDVVHWGMNVQESTESPKFRSFQMHSSFGTHDRRPGYIRMDARWSQEVVDKLTSMGYEVEYNKPDTGNFYAPAGENTGNLSAILFDWEHQTITGGASIMAERYGIGW